MQDPAHRDLTQKAAAVLVFPQLTKAGAGIGKPVLAFVFGEKGLIADASLQGAKITRLSEQ